MSKNIQKLNTRVDLFRVSCEEIRHGKKQKRSLRGGSHILYSDKSGDLDTGCGG